MNGQISTIPFFDSLCRIVINVSKFDSNIGTNCSKIEKWKAGVTIFLIFLQYEPENTIEIRVHSIFYFKSKRVNRFEDT